MKLIANFGAEDARLLCLIQMPCSASFHGDRVRSFPNSTATSFLGRTRSFVLGIFVKNNILN